MSCDGTRGTGASIRAKGNKFLYYPKIEEGRKKAMKGALG
jgi:hypothetical protein